MSRRCNHHSARRLQSLFLGRSSRRHLHRSAGPSTLSTSPRLRLPCCCPSCTVRLPPTHPPSAPPSASGAPPRRRTLPAPAAARVHPSSQGSRAPTPHSPGSGWPRLRPAWGRRPPRSPPGGTPAGGRRPSSASSAPRDGTTPRLAARPRRARGGDSDPRIRPPRLDSEPRPAGWSAPRPAGRQSGCAEGHCRQGHNESSENVI